MSRLLTTTLLVLLLIVAAMPPSAGAAPTRASKTVASEWKETVASRRGTSTRSAQDRPRLAPHGHEGDAQAARRISPSVTYTSPPHRAPNRFNAVGPHWKASVPDGATVEVYVRTSADGAKWGEWRLLEPNHGDEARDRDGRSFGSLVIGALSTHAQYRVKTYPSPRGEWPRVSDVTLTFIDSTAGPTAQQAQASVTTGYRTQSLGAVPAPTIISRADWGADESLRYDDQGKEVWPKRCLQVTKAVLHDTVTPNNPSNPAAVVRSIYYYHAVTRGWGDIGYNYLIDEQGRIYEGRHGGKNVVGGHGLCYNFGSVGIAALGWHGPAYGGTPEGVPPSEAMVASFKKLTAWLFDMHGVDPLGRGIFMKKNIEPLADLPNIIAHHDLSRSSVPCNNTHVDPGSYLYNRIPEIRQAVADMMGYKPTPNPAIQSVKFTPTSLYMNQDVRVDITIRNAGTGLMETQGPNPATVYLESQDFEDLGFAKVPGKYRVFVEQSGNPTGEIRPYRFGLGSPLLRGETRTITGFITLPRTGVSTWWGGLNQESIRTVVERMGDTDVVVAPPGSTMPTITSRSRWPHSISPNGDGVQDGSRVQATFSEPVTWTLEIRDSTGGLVRAYTGSGSSASVVWNGKTASGQVVPDGAYSYWLLYTDTEGAPGMPSRDYIYVDTIKPTLSSPVAAGYGPYRLTFSVGERSAVWVRIVNSAGKQAAAFPRTTREVGRPTLTWGGKLPDGTYAPGGTYYWNVYGIDAAGNKSNPYPLRQSFKVSAPIQVIDNKAASFSASSNWVLGSYNSPYAGGYRWRKANASDTDRATFSATLASGTYDVYVWYTSGTNRAKTARYSVSTSAGVKTVLVNQQTGGGAWRLIGRYTMAAGANRVSLDAADGTAGVLIADAVRWVRR